jgi:hypothetical protein
MIGVGLGSEDLFLHFEFFTFCACLCVSAHLDCHVIVPFADVFVLHFNLCWNFLHFPIWCAEFLAQYAYQCYLHSYVVIDVEEVPAASVFRTAGWGSRLLTNGNHPWNFTISKITSSRAKFSVKSVNSQLTSVIIWNIFQRLDYFWYPLCFESWL